MSSFALISNWKLLRNAKTNARTHSYKSNVTSKKNVKPPKENRRSLSTENLRPMPKMLVFQKRKQTKKTVNPVAAAHAEVAAEDAEEIAGLKRLKTQRRKLMRPSRKRASPIQKPSLRQPPNLSAAAVRPQKAKRSRLSQMKRPLKKQRLMRRLGKADVAVVPPAVNQKSRLKRWLNSLKR